MTDRVEDLRPAHGARFELDHEGTTADEARYRARVHLPAARHDLRLRLALPGGACALDEEARQPAEAPELPEWVRAHLVALGRQLYREAQREGAWKRRLVRWRERS